MSGESDKELEVFLSSWPAEQAGLKRALLALKESVEGRPGAVLTYVARPGISNSLRLDMAPRPAGRQRQLFAMLDVVADAGELFLSVCFYADEISDPEELGNAIPQGLFGETGYCFDLDDYDEALVAYLKERLAEAHRSASR